MFVYGLLLLVALWGTQCEARRLIGPYDFILHNVSKCRTDNSIYTVQWEPNFQQYNYSTLTYSDNVTLPSGLNDNISISFDVSVLVHGVWQPNYINIKLLKGCSDLQKLAPNSVASYFKAAGVTFKCPVRSGKFYFRNWVTNFEMASGISFLPYNTYKMEISFMQSVWKVLCIVAVCDFVPKAPKAKH